jgi:hypothetical protein
MIRSLQRQLAASILLLIPALSNAAAVDSATASIVSVRTYPLGGAGLRAQIQVSGGTHNCGTAASVYYFDSDKIGIEAVKAVLAVALTAQASQRAIFITYDCSFGGGGYGWGYAIQVN